jgi:hypothetical protein
VSDREAGTSRRMSPPSARTPPGDPSLLRDALLVGLAGLGLALLLDALVLDQPAPRGDELIYELMAREPFEPHTFPFAYRIGAPLLVNVLPFGSTFSFSLLAWLSCGAAAAVAYVLMRRFGAGRPLAAALALCLATCPPLLVTSLRQGRGVDPESVLVMLAGALAIADRRPVALGAIVAVGALFRESALFLVPFAYAAWAEGPLDPAVARRVALATAPGVAAYVVLRLAIPTVGREQVLGYGSLVGGRADVLREALGDPIVQARRLAISFGPLWLAAPFALPHLRFARAALVLVGLCAVAMLFAADWGRIILLAAPFFYVAGAWSLQRRPRLAAAAVAAFAAMNVGYAVYMDRTGVERNIINGPLPTYPVR